MQDLQQTLEQFLDYLKGIWIKKRYIIISSWLICPIGFMYVSTLPDTYTSTTKVYVDTRSVLQPLLRGLAIQTNPEQEIAMMARTLLSRQNLEAIARNTDLDITTRSETEFEALLDSLRDGIKLTTANRRDSFYSLAYSNPEPEVARRVVDETLKLFMESSLGNSRRDSDSAQRFIDEQINEYERRLIEAEQRLADFKRKYSTIMPESGSYYANLSALENSLESTRLQIKEAKRKIELMQSQLNQQGQQARDSFSVGQGDSELALSTRYDTRIQELESKLDQLRLRFTSLHPDVIETKNLLDNLMSLRNEEIQSYLSADNEIGETITSPLGTEISIQLNQFKAELASLEVREQDFQNKINLIKDKIDLVPQIEAESTALNRDYGITKQKYEELLSRRESAELSEKADISAEDVQFRIIEPPNLPRTPESTRLLMHTAVLVVGFGAGFALAFLISQLSPVLTSAKQLTALTNMPILGSVTHLDIAKINRVNRSRLAMFIVSSGTVLGIYSVLVAAELMNINLYAKVMS